MSDIDLIRMDLVLVMRALSMLAAEREMPGMARLLRDRADKTEADVEAHLRPIP